MRNTDRQVLIVDDYNTMRRILRNLLGQIGFANVEEAEDGAGGLKKMREHNIGLVISDWNMAPMSGLEFLKEVRSDALLKETPFIMITAESKTEKVVAAKEAGGGLGFREAIGGTSRFGPMRTQFTTIVAPASVATACGLFQLSCTALSAAFPHRLPCRVTTLSTARRSDWASMERSQRWRQ